MYRDEALTQKETCGVQAQQLTIYEVIKPSSRWLEIPLLAGFNLVLVLSSYLAFNLPFSPVPITGQTFAVLVIGMTLGRARGTAVVLAYLVEGACGLPVFAGGLAGLPYLFGPTGGYLIGFVAATYAMGYLAERGWHKSLWKALPAMIAGEIVIYACGLAWLAHFVPNGALIATGLLPFLPGAAFKIAAASAVLPTAWRLAGRKS
jgi:biotin transport system substrate-specific component